MEQREKLIELIIESVHGCARYWAELIADNLIDNGVVLPCRCIECVHFDRGRWKCTRANWESTHFNAFCSYGERKGGDE